MGSCADPCCEMRLIVIKETGCNDSSGVVSFAFQLV